MTRPAVEVEDLDLEDASVMAHAYAVECAATRASRRGWVPLGEAARVAAWRAGHGWDYRLVGAFEAGRLLGFASCATTHDTPGTAWLDVAVAPEHQGGGTGTRLVEAAEAAAPECVGRFVANAYRPALGDIDRLVERFAQPLGYAPATTETVVELDLADTDIAAPHAPEGYTLATYLDGVPASHRAEVGVLKGLVDAEAPHGELGWQPTPVSPREYQDEITLWQQQGRTAIESIALDPAGQVAAWTCLVVARDGARAAQVQGTLVLSRHRGRGLGRAVKTASLRAALEHGRARRVRTSSDDTNVWMRAINDALGFAPVECEVVLHKLRVRGA